MDLFTQKKWRVFGLLLISMFALSQGMRANAVDSLLLNYKFLYFDLYQPDSIQLICSPTPPDTAVVSWLSSDPDVAGVDSAGLVVPVLESNDTILVTVSVAVDTVVTSDTCQVTVVNSTYLRETITEGDSLNKLNYTQSSWARFEESFNAVMDTLALVEDSVATQLSIDAATAQLNAAIANLETISFTVSPSSAYLDKYSDHTSSVQLYISLEELTEEYEVSWTSSLPEIASVDGNGLVTALKESNDLVTITASLDLTSGVTGSSKITVVNSLQLREAIGVADTKEEINYDSQSWLVFQDSLNAAKKTLIRVESKLASQAEISRSTWQLNDAMGRLIPNTIESFSINMHQLEFCPGNPAMTLSAVFVPEEAVRPVTWESSNPEVAIVDQNGMVTPVSAGIADVYAWVSGNGDTYADTCHVQVAIDSRSVIVQKWDNTLIVNNNFQSNGGYHFAEGMYQWFENGIALPGATGQYYSVGDNASDKLNPRSFYSVKMTTTDGKTLFTCPSTFSSTSNSTFLAYPNPVQVGEAVTVVAELSEEELRGASVQVVDLKGNLIHSENFKGKEMQIFIKNSGYHIIRVSTPDGTKSGFKILAK